MKTVGIIGGLGPETTSEFYLDLVFSCAKKDISARPLIIISSVPLPYQIEEDLILRSEGMERYIPYLVAEARRLEKAGAEFIVMPCNSLHVFIRQIRDSVSIPVLSIVEETVKFLKRENMNKSELQQAKMGKFILNLVVGQQKNRDREELISIINDFENKGLDCVILACTDLQLLIPTHQNLKIFDTMKIFADATVQEIIKG
ncbi:aspartate/glutamate racemase family protein [Candidatus Daviesbacteria bacterium]|nr:aspartate/glutamate racemase family protein [Candidatus Daviesbacteria bacterium]